MAHDLGAARRILRALAERTSTVRIAADTGIHQSQVSRLVRGQFKRLSPNVQTLVDYARKPKRYSAQQTAEDGARESVVRAALRIWDATPRGAHALVRLLRSVEGITRLRRSR